MMKQKLRTTYYDILESLTGHRGVRVQIGPEARLESYVVPLRWRRWFGENYEVPTFDFVAAYCRSGMTFVDIGAHFGIFTIAAAKRLGPQGHIFSFEPCPSTRAVMREFLHLNPVDAAIEIREEAVSGQSGMQKMYFSPIPGDPANTLFQNQSHQVEREINVTTLDDFVAAHSLKVDCLKIDAEGAELAILRGGRTLMSRQHPNTHLSLHPAQIELSGGSLKEIWDLAAEYGMQIKHTDHKEIAHDWFCSQRELFEVLLLPS